MNHGFAKTIDALLVNGPMRARDIAASIKPPKWWTQQRTARNVYTLLSCYAGKRWIRVRRGVYDSNNGRHVRREQKEGE